LHLQNCAPQAHVVKAHDAASVPGTGRSHDRASSPHLAMVSLLLRLAEAAARLIGPVAFHGRRALLAWRRGCRGGGLCNAHAPRLDGRAASCICYLLSLLLCCCRQAGGLCCCLWGVGSAIAGLAEATVTALAVLRGSHASLVSLEMQGGTACHLFRKATIHLAVVSSLFLLAKRGASLILEVSGHGRGAWRATRARARAERHEQQQTTHSEPQRNPARRSRFWFMGTE
jgi:hypothetical protein